ncbi:hypothetical protein NLO85_27750, partial [Pseudomonas savastanoi]
ARLRFLVSDAMCKPVLRRDRLDFGYDNRFQNPTICSRRLPSSLPQADPLLCNPNEFDLEGTPPWL